MKKKKFKIKKLYYINNYLVLKKKLIIGMSI